MLKHGHLRIFSCAQTERVICSSDIINIHPGLVYRRLGKRIQMHTDMQTHTRATNILTTGVLYQNRKQQRRARIFEPAATWCNQDQPGSSEASPPRPRPSPRQSVSRSGTLQSWPPWSASRPLGHTSRWRLLHSKELDFRAGPMLK